MKLLHRHIFSSVLFTCLVSAAMVMFVILVGNTLKSLLGYVLAGQISAGLFFQLVALLIPYTLSHAFPLGVLVGVLLVFGRMSAQSEITAMRASGLSIAWISRPVFIIALLGVLFAGGINLYYMPMTRVMYRETIHQALRDNIMNIVEPRTFIRDFRGMVIYVDKKEEDRVSGVWVWQLDKQGRTRVVYHAQEGQLNWDSVNRALIAQLSEVTVEYRDDKNPEDFSQPREFGSFGETTLEFPLGGFWGSESLNFKPSYLTLQQLLEKRREAFEQEGMRGPEWMKYSLALHYKFASACIVLAFALIGVPLGIRVSRQETSANLGVAAVLAVSYYLFAAIAEWLGKYPQIRPDLLQWTPLLIFLILGSWMLRKVGRM